MKSRPILFNPQMIRAILDGKKTQTRRPLKFWQIPAETEDKQSVERFPDMKYHAIAQIHSKWGFSFYAKTIEELCEKYLPTVCPFGRVGDQLWVRETFADLSGMGFDQKYAYRADTEKNSEGDQIRKQYGVKWKPSIHMPRAASRITLEITNIRVEKLKDISPQDAIAEGLSCATKDKFLDKYGLSDWPWTCWDKDPRVAFLRLWSTVYGDEDFEQLGNPYVWAVDFKRANT